jgi:hypothetical protein
MNICPNFEEKNLLGKVFGRWDIRQIDPRELYRRNFKKGITFALTWKMCIRNEKISCGNPCPICRDEYLVSPGANPMNKFKIKISFFLKATNL